MSCANSLRIVNNAVRSCTTRRTAVWGTDGCSIDAMFSSAHRAWANKLAWRAESVSTLGKTVCSSSCKRLICSITQTWSFGGSERMEGAGCTASCVGGVWSTGCAWRGVASVAIARGVFSLRVRTTTARCNQFIRNDSVLLMSSPRGLIFFFPPPPPPFNRTRRHIQSTGGRDHSDGDGGNTEKIAAKVLAFT